MFIEKSMRKIINNDKKISSIKIKKIIFEGPKIKFKRNEKLKT